MMLILTLQNYQLQNEQEIVLFFKSILNVFILINISLWYAVFAGLQFIYIKLATVVEGDLKGPFSLATTPRCRGGRYSFSWITSLYPWFVHYDAEY